jgi:hypothetical protein
MVRIRFMPSDFHPLLLVLGDRGDLRDLAALLDRFADEDGDVGLDTVAVPTSTKVRMTKASDRFGLWPEPSGEDSFVWRLSPSIAQDFRDIILELAEERHASGSETLQYGSIGEVPVKVSHGEFTDDFLLPNSTFPS